MILYSIESKSGTIGRSWDEWKIAKKIYEVMKGHWNNPEGNKIFWCYDDKELSDEEALEHWKGISEEDFYTIHKPKKMFQIGYYQCGYYIEKDPNGIIQEIKNSVENDSFEELEIQSIMISEFELSKLPEFQGF